MCTEYLLDSSISVGIKEDYIENRGVKMPARPSIVTERSSKSRNLPIFLRVLVLAIKFLVSPLVVLADSFRRKGTLDKTWLYSFFLLVTVIMGLTGLGMLVTEGPMMKTLKMMATLTESREVLAGDLQPIIRIINRYALQYNVDPNLIYAIVKTESNFQPTAVSRAGARGLMQIMPEVWQEYNGLNCTGRHDSNTICSSGDCIFAPEANIRVGVKYFRVLLDNYQGRVDLALEAYNAGLSNVKPGVTPKYRETRGYIGKITMYWQELRKYTISQQLQACLRLQSGLKWLFGTVFFFWLILFWWSNRKLFSK